MKKSIKIAAALLAVLMLLLSFGCGGPRRMNAAEESEPVEDVTYINDTLYYTFYLASVSNYENYVGKKYSVEGMFHMNEFEGKKTPMVFRYHLETDPEDGKEYAYYRGFTLEGDDLPLDLPEKTWIRVVGTLEAEPHGDHVHVSLVVESWEEIKTHGNEYVS